LSYISELPYGCRLFIIPKIVIIFVVFPEIKGFDDWAADPWEDHVWQQGDKDDAWEE